MPVPSERPPARRRLTIRTPTYSNAGAGISGFPQIYSCATTFKSVVPGQYGAWGNFIDGCTVTLTCRASTGLAGPGGISDTQSCDVSGHSFIENYHHLGERVTMNARTRRCEAGGHLCA